MASKVTTSVVVRFATGDQDGTLLVEVDDRDKDDGGLNGGRSSFNPGDNVFLLLYKSSNVVLDHSSSSLGTLTKTGTTVVTQTEQVTFAGEEEATVRYPISGSILTTTWFGNNLGNISVVGETAVRIPTPASGYSVGIAEITYRSNADIYRLSHSALSAEEYSIVAFYAGHTN